jgi:hypothetical protein
VYLDIYNVIDGYGLDRTGREAYLFVGPRHTDIGDQITKAMTGNNSYAGHIPVETTGFASAHICRNILYPAVIFANPGRNVISSCFMNFRDGNTWKCNDGKDYPDFVTQKMKQFGFSHGRFYEGHAIWSGLLERYNTGWHFSIIVVMEQVDLGFAVYMKTLRNNSHLLNQHMNI